MKFRKLCFFLLGLGGVIWLFMGCADTKPRRTQVIHVPLVESSQIDSSSNANPKRISSKEDSAARASAPKQSAEASKADSKSKAAAATENRTASKPSSATARRSESKNEAPKNTEPLIMENADKLEGFRSKGEYILTGRVRFRHGQLRFETERAVWSKELNQVSCEAGMRITQRGAELVADRGTYSKARNEAEAEGHVQLRDSTGDLRGQGGRLTYHRLTHDVVFWGAPELRRFYRDTVVSGTAKIDSTGKKEQGKINDTLTLKALRMTYNDSTLIAVAESSVVITKKKTLITCARAEYRDKADSLFLTGDPKVSVDRSQIVGDKMRMRVQEEEIRGLLVQGGAKAVSLDPKTDSTPERQSEIRGDSLLLAFTGKYIDSAQVFRDADGLYFDTNRPKLRNHMRGKHMIMRFKDREVHTAQVVGSARSTYYHLENGHLRGRNVAQGDSIRFAFANGKIDEVLVTGQAHGTYFGKQSAKRDTSNAAADSIRQEGQNK